MSAIIVLILMAIFSFMLLGWIGLAAYIVFMGMIAVVLIPIGIYRTRRRRNG